MFKYLSVWKTIFTTDRLAVGLIVGGLMLNIIGAVLLRITVPPSTPSVILHYNVFFGIDVFGFEIEKMYIQIFFASIGSFIIWLSNAVIGSILYWQVLHDLSLRSQDDSVHRQRKKVRDYYLDYFDANRLASYLLWASSVVVQLIVLIYVISVILVNK